MLDAPVMSGIEGPALLPVPTGTEDPPVATIVGKVLMGAEEAWMGESPRLDETGVTEEVWLP